MGTGRCPLSLAHPFSRQSFGLQRVQKIWALLLRPTFGRGRGRSLEPLQLLQGVRLESGGGAIVCFMGQIVLNAVKADAARSTLVVVTKGQGGENAAAAAVLGSLSQSGPLAQVNRAVSFRAGASCPTGRNLLLHCQAQDGGRRSRGSSSGSGGGCSSSSIR